MLDTGMCFNVLCMMEIIMSTAYISNGNFKAFIIRVLVTQKMSLELDTLECINEHT